MPGFLSARERNKLRAKSVAEELSKVAPELRSPLPAGAPITPASVTGLLRKYRRLGKLPGLSTDAHLALRKRYEAALERIFLWNSYQPEDFGIKNGGHKELAETFVAMLERKGYIGRPLSKMRKLRGEFVGELLELLVQNHELFQKYLKGMAKKQVGILNLAETELVDARGTLVPPASRKGTFQPVRKATDIVVVNSEGKNPRKFLDVAYVSDFKHDPAEQLAVGDAGGGEEHVVAPDQVVDKSGSGPKMWSFAVETEIRMPAKARKSGKQIGRAQLRFDLASGDKIKMVVEGEAKPVELEAEEIIFATNSIDRVLITIPEKPFQLRKPLQFRPSFTTRGGYPEYFWRLEVAMDTEEIWRIVNELTR
jgi:hypothetical protein